MKRFLILLVAIAALFLVSTPKAEVDSYLVIENLVDAGMEISKIGNFDTLLAANDSITLFTKRQISQCCLRYYIQLGARTGTSKDTAIFTIVVDVFDGNDSLIDRYVSPDTSTDLDDGRLMQLPIYGTTNSGATFTAKILAQHGASTETQQTIFNIVQAVGTRPITLKKVYR